MFYRDGFSQQFIQGHLDGNLPFPLQKIIVSDEQLPELLLPADLDIDDDALKGTEAIIYSMTIEERTKPSLINPSRKRRIAEGAGVDISEVNRLIKQFEQSRKMMKQMSGMMSGKRMKRGKFNFPFGGL